jgi:prepilin-type N-terminal cleavage/methylation domain-containing protein
MRGFTLIEAVMAVAIVGIGLVGVIYAFHGMGTSSLLADQTVMASNIARGALESVQASRDSNGYFLTLGEIQAGSYNLIPVTSNPSFNLTVTAVEVDPDKDAGATDDFLDSSLGSGYGRVTATVNWNNGGNSLSLVTMIAHY